MTEVPPPRLCKTCGYKYRWYIECEPSELDRQIFPDEDTALRSESDVIEQSCPHDNGTIFQLCPSCNSRVGMWGAGMIGTMECDCWEQPCQ